jgi:uncharacterized protein with PQ loop repeat
MFSSITWEIFLSTVVVMVGGYYVITTLLLYHNEIIHWVKSRGQKSVVKIASTEVHAQPDGMMGSIRNELIAELRSSTASAEEINVSSVDEEPEEIQAIKPLSNDSLLIGSMADLLQEIKTLIQLITECKSDKTECVSLFRTLLLRYPHLSDTTYQDVINLYIAEATMNQTAFNLTLPEIKTWWEEESTSKN